jgi:hypothetical protein
VDVLKVAFIVQRYGLEVNGGSEFLCRKVAEHMAKYWDIEILTSCAITARELKLLTASRSDVSL